MPTINKIIIAIGLLALSFTAFSQTKVITFSPLGFVDKIRVKYEKSLNNNISAGTYFNFYYAIFKGIRIDPFIRIYPAGKAPKGLYIQGKAVLGFFNSSIKYTYEGLVDTLSLTKSQTFPTYGAGLGLGYQFLLGKSKFPIDLYLGFQHSKFAAPNTVIKNNMRYETMDDANWYLTGPGSFINMNFGIGFTF